MSKVSYEHYAKRYETTKPIRGRSTDVRPIGQRRRDWETITKKAIDEGMWSYSAHLYSTECVEYLPNGDVILRSGGWPTPTTAEFIDTHSPFHCWKQGGKLWIRARSFKDVTAYPLNGELRMNWKGEHNYAPATEVVINKQVIDRVKAKAAREPIKPFLDYAKTMLTLSDGWVMHETKKIVLGWQGDKPEDYAYSLGYVSEHGLYEALMAQQDIEPEQVYMQTICRMAGAHIEYEECRIAEQYEFEVSGHGRTWTRRKEFKDYRISFERLKRKMYSLVQKHEDVHKIVQVKPTNKGMYGTV